MRAHVNAGINFVPQLGLTADAATRAIFDLGRNALQAFTEHGAAMVMFPGIEVDIAAFEAFHAPESNHNIGMLRETMLTTHPHITFHLCATGTTQPDSTEAKCGLVAVFTYRDLWESSD